MINIKVDGPNTVCEGELRGFGGQLIAECTMALAYMLVTLEKQGLPIEQASKMIGDTLPGIIEVFRDHLVKKG